MAAEILVVTPAIRALIRDDKVHQIYSSMQSGKKYGMQTLNDALYALYMAREVTLGRVPARERRSERVPAHDRQQPPMDDMPPIGGLQASRRRYGSGERRAAR